MFKVKKATDGSIGKYKAGFVAMGYSQVKGIDYEEPMNPLDEFLVGIHRWAGLSTRWV